MGATCPRFQIDSWLQLLTRPTRSAPTNREVADTCAICILYSYGVATSPSCNTRNPLLWILGVQAGMKSQSCIIWVLGALMFIAAVDAIPDPPAVNSHAVSVASRISEARGGVCEWRLKSDWSCTSSHLQIRWIVFRSADEPNLPSDWIVLTGYAADPSPPVFEGQRNLYFRS